MIRRKKHLYFKVIKYKNISKNPLEVFLKKSFIKNFRVNAVHRISFLLRNNYTNSDLQFYNSQNKLQCNWEYSFSVPSKRLNVSRFILGRYTNKLVFGGYQKT